MSVHFLWTTSSKAGASLIRWGTNGKASHFAVGFDMLGDRGVVFHSHLSGLRIDWAKDFMKNNRIVWELEPILSLQLQAEERLYQAVTKNYGTPYDYKALLYFGWRVFLKKILGWSIPKYNKWGDKKAFLCTEIAETMSEELKDIFQVELPKYKGMISPDLLFHTMKESKFLREG